WTAGASPRRGRAVSCAVRARVGSLRTRTARSRARAGRRARAGSGAASPEASLARSESSLYLSLQAIKRKHALERLGIALYDSETRMQWSYNGDAFFHAASTMKLAVLVGVFRQV